MENLFVVLNLLFISLFICFVIHQKIEIKKNNKKRLERYKRRKIDAIKSQSEIYKKYEIPEKVDCLVQKLIQEINSCHNEETVDDIYYNFSKRVSEAIFNSFKQSKYKEGHFCKSNVLNNKQQLLHILGFKENITDFSIIKNQYIKLIKKYHPDNLESGNLEKSQKIIDAYSQLKTIYER